jgi:glycosyltransferase involved in cell wall biosynthesis
MNICIDLLWLKSSKIGGLEYFARTLLVGIQAVDSKNTYFILIPGSEINNVKEFTSPNFKIFGFDFNNLNKFLRVYKENAIVKNFVTTQRIDLVYFPNHNVSLIKLPCKTVSTVPDMRYAFYKKGITPFQLLYFKLTSVAAKKYNDIIVFISDATKKDFVSTQGNRGNLYTIYVPIKVETKINKPENSQKEFLKTLELEPKKYIYTVSSFMFHKNLPTLLTAISLLKKKIPDIKLVISGVGGISKQEVLKTIKEKNIEKNIVITGFVSEEEKQILYNNASLFVFSSFFEGFGIPPVEAVLSKLPVIVSDIPVMREILENNFKVFYIKEYMNPAAWASKISEVLEGNKDFYIPDEAFVAELKKRYDPIEIAKLYISLFKKLSN